MSESESNSRLVAPPSQGAAWIGRASKSINPPEDYWKSFADDKTASKQVASLRNQMKNRLNEFKPEDLPPPMRDARTLLKRVASDGWVEPVEKILCPDCRFELSADEASLDTCQNCDKAFSEIGVPEREIVYVRNLQPTRDVDWVIAIHGMNTTGAWQEAFSWHLGTTWGHSVPVAIYKYGTIVTGVVLAWRRRTLQKNLREKLAAFRAEAHARDSTGKPDVIAHSFGTWLLGHLLKDELKRDSKDQLKFGRIIMAGCILRPDFDWEEFKKAGLVEEVLNHYGTKDLVVPLAQATIWNSGPSGRRGFDGDQVYNIRAEGFGHSDLFSIEKCVINGQYMQKCSGNGGHPTHLEIIYKRYWRPFLTLPSKELKDLPNRQDPKTVWRPLPWLLRGTVFPFIALPLLLGILAFLIGLLGEGLWEIRCIFRLVAILGFVGLGALAAGIGIFWRRMRS